MPDTTIKIIFATSIIHAIIFARIVLSEEATTTEIPIEKEIANMFTPSTAVTDGDPEEKEKDSPICSNNECKLRLRLLYGQRSIEGKAEFRTYGNRTLMGQETLTYKNTENGLSKTLGFRITIKYPMGAPTTVKLSAVYSWKGKIIEKGVNVQRLIVPAICSPDLTPVPLFRLCLKLTDVTFHKDNKIELCLAIRIQFSVIGLLNLYKKCMNVTTTPPSDNAEAIMANFQTSGRGQSSSQKQTEFQHEGATSVEIDSGGERSQKEHSTVTGTKSGVNDDKKQEISSDVEDKETKGNHPDDKGKTTSSDGTDTEFIVPVETVPTS